MSEFDHKAGGWDANPEHWERSGAVAKHMQEMIPLEKHMKAMEFGAGTAILSFLLHEQFEEVVLLDSSPEMVKVMQNKIAGSEIGNLKPILFDLEHNDYHQGRFDIIYTQMVLHHIGDIEILFKRFNDIINPGGYLAIADLYTEDGSFHKGDTGVHKGFDVDGLAKILKKNHFTKIAHKQCYIVKRDNGNGQVREYPVFLLVAGKKQ
jgi:tRNA (cmo5U34)-methyltransferase